MGFYLMFGMLNFEFVGSFFGCGDDFWFCWFLFFLFGENFKLLFFFFLSLVVVFFFFNFFVFWIEFIVDKVDIECYVVWDFCFFIFYVEFNGKYGYVWYIFVYYYLNNNVYC